MAIEEEVSVTCINANEWKQKMLAKGIRNSSDDSISNSDLRKSTNDDDDSTDESSSSDEGRVASRQVGPGPPPPSSLEGSEERLESDESEEDEDEVTRPTAAPGFHAIGHGGHRAANQACETEQDAKAGTEEQAQQETRFLPEETLLIFDWDDTVLPSSWVQSQGLRLDDSSEVQAWQREQLNEVAKAAAETLRIAKQLGTVVLITNAERGWIELSCQKFMPTLYPLLESIKVLSARTSFECQECVSPLDWKVVAFHSEITRVYSADGLKAADRRKNVLSLGDSIHEREALMRATSSLPNCRSKSLKFVERPDIAQICKQHSLVTSCFERIAHHDGNLDLCIRCT